MVDRGEIVSVTTWHVIVLDEALLDRLVSLEGFRVRSARAQTYQYAILAIRLDQAFEPARQ